MIIAIFNNKGGVGKTTTAVHLGYALAQQGKKVLCVDLDRQANLLGHLFDEEHVSALKHRQNGKAQGAISHEAAKMDILPLSFWQAESKDYIDAIHKAASNYDVVLIDCPPSLEVRSESALYAADFVLVPTEPEKLSFDGIGNLLEEFDKYHVHLLGIIITRFQKKKVAHHGYVNLLTSKYPRDIIKKHPVIDSSVFPTASAMSITGYEQSGKRKNAALEAYNEIAKIIVRRAENV